MKDLSLWNKTTSMENSPQLEGDINTDVLVVGGGAAGILSAYLLTLGGADCVLVEGKRLCTGVTGNTTAKLTLQHGLSYDNLIKMRGIEYAAAYYSANNDALNSYRELARGIDCEFEEKSAFVYSMEDFERLKREHAAYSTLGEESTLHRTTPLPLNAAGMVEVKNQAQFHPLKLFYHLASRLKIYENTFIRALDGTTAVTDRGKIRANKVIVATHFPFINSHGVFFVKLYQHRSYVIALENAPQLGGMYVDEAETGMSFRNHGPYLLIGGGDHKTGKLGGGWQELREFAAVHYPQGRERFMWATQDCMSLDAVPYIGRYSPNTPDVFVAAGFNKWGMTSSMVAAKLLSELIIKGKSEYEEIFSPQRSMKGSQLIKNGLAAAGGLLTPAVKRCPHMGCALKWNPAEKSWDCPCHGSRFDEHGRLTDNPAMKDIKK